MKTAYKSHLRLERSNHFLYAKQIQFFSQSTEIKSLSDPKTTVKPQPRLLKQVIRVKLGKKPYETNRVCLSGLEREREVL